MPLHNILQWRQRSIERAEQVRCEKQKSTWNNNSQNPFASSREYYNTSSNERRPRSISIDRHTPTFIASASLLYCRQPANNMRYESKRSYAFFKEFHH